MREPAAPRPDRLAGLRAHAARQRQATIDRLRDAIASLEAAGRPVSATTIREVSGLAYMAYYRNAEAFALYRRHSTHLRADRERAQADRAQWRRDRQPPPDDGRPGPPPDPLLACTKARLVAEVRAAQAAREEWECRYNALVQHHMECGMMIARLEATVAQHEAFLEGIRRARREQEQEPGP